MKRTLSSLAPPGRWRLNVHVGAAKFIDLTGESPGDLAARDFSEADVIVPHPVYGSLGWVAVVNPADRTTNSVLELLRDAHDDEWRRVDRRAEAGDRESEAGPSR